MLKEVVVKQKEMIARRAQDSNSVIGARVVSKTKVGPTGVGSRKRELILPKIVNNKPEISKKLKRLPGVNLIEDNEYSRALSTINSSHNNNEKSPFPSLTPSKQKFVQKTITSLPFNKPQKLKYDKIVRTADVSFDWENELEKIEREISNNDHKKRNGVGKDEDGEKNISKRRDHNMNENEKAIGINKMKSMEVSKSISPKKLRKMQSSIVQNDNNLLTRQNSSYSKGGRSKISQKPAVPKFSRQNVDKQNKQSIKDIEKDKGSSPKISKDKISQENKSKLNSKSLIDKTSGKKIDRDKSNDKLKEKKEDERKVKQSQQSILENELSYPARSQKITEILNSDKKLTESHLNREGNKDIEIMVKDKDANRMDKSFTTSNNPNIHPVSSNNVNMNYSVSLSDSSAQKNSLKRRHKDVESAQASNNLVIDKKT